MSLKDAFLNWRNRRLVDPEFQRRSAAFPLSRPMAQASANSLFNLCAGFVYTQVLLACVELDLFEKLRAGPMPAPSIAKATGLPEDGAMRLLKAASALQLVERFSKNRFGLGFRGAALLGNPSVFAMIRHHATLYKDLADPVALLKDRTRSTALESYWGYSTADDPSALEAQSTSAYTELMAATQSFIAREVTAAHDFTVHRSILDVGGGGGAFISAVANAAPDASLGLFDLPSVGEHARANLTQQNLADRIKIFGGNFFEDPLPGGFDAITLVRILHDHDEDDVMKLLRNARRALAPGASLIIAEPMAGTPGSQAMGDAYFGLYLWAMGSGEPRTPATLADMLKDAGFTQTNRRKTTQPLFVQVLVAQ
ncbi:MAG: methyltransferase [Pseudomonadota bacterium]